MIILPTKKGEKNIKEIHWIMETNVEEHNNDDGGGRDVGQ